MNIDQIQKELKTGQVAPHTLAQYKDFLAASASEILDEQLSLQLGYSQYFMENRDKYKSDNALRQSWSLKEEGKRELTLHTMQKRIKSLVGAISSHLRLSSEEARNIY